MTESEFKDEMSRRGWSAEEINDFIDRSKGAIALPLEYWLQDKPKTRTYYTNGDGVIVDEEQ